MFNDFHQRQMDSKHDAAFLDILREEKNITSFLDGFFGFLYRCTDFYVESSPDQKLGFPPGIAEKLVVNTLRKWQNIRTVTDTQMQAEAAPPLAIEEIEVAGNAVVEVIGANSENLDSSSSYSKGELGAPSQNNNSSEASNSDSYNGASYASHKWSQTVSDLDAVVAIPTGARRSKDVRVELSADGLEVAVLRALTDSEEGGLRHGGEEGDDERWRTLVKGRFLFKIKTSESFWCLEPGKHISLHLQKSSERWWECLLDNEPRLELSKLDCSRQLEDMGESEQMKVEELMWNQRRKLLGQPTSEQIRMERILQQAWNAEGSPFKGTEYDPSIVKFN